MFFCMLCKFMSLAFPGNNLKFKIVLLFIFHGKLFIWKLFWFSNYGPECTLAIRLQGSLKCYISRKKLGIRLIFCKQINIKFSNFPIFNFGGHSQLCPKHSNNNFAKFNGTSTYFTQMFYSFPNIRQALKCTILTIFKFFFHSMMLYNQQVTL